MTHKSILKVKKFQLSSAKRSGTVEEKCPGGRGGGWIPSPISFRVKEREVIYFKPVLIPKS